MALTDLRISSRTRNAPRNIDPIINAIIRPAIAPPNPPACQPPIMATSKSSHSAISISTAHEFTMSLESMLCIPRSPADLWLL